MPNGKFAALGAASLLCAALAAPAQARPGCGGMRGGSLVAGGQSCRHDQPIPSRPFVSERAFLGRPFYPYRRLITPYDGIGVFYFPHLSCWTWIPTSVGWQRVWECKYPEGYAYRM